MVALIRLIVALQMLALPMWVGAAMVRPSLGPARRLARAGLPVVGIAAVLVVLALIEGSGQTGAVLRTQALAAGFAFLLAGLAVFLERFTGPRAAQMLTFLLGTGLVAGILLVGPVVEMLDGEAKAAVVRLAVYPNPLVTAQYELGLPWLHQSLTYRLTPLGESYRYLLKDLAWWKTVLAHVFVGSGFLVFSRRRKGA